ncbi:FtsH protease activity modulator HflK, partial [bacterium]|nr:FtsH protease activity modulator HflK [bacterium]
PFGVDELIRVPVQRQLKQEFGFQSTGLSHDQRTQYKKVPDEANMLTGDLSTAEVEWVVQYRIAEPELYLFRVRNVEETLRDLSEAVMREVVGDRTVNEVITIGRTEIASLVHQRLQELLTLYETGLVVDQLVLQDVNPPDRVKPAFNEVNQAQQELEQKISVAEKQKNEAIPRSLGEAQQMVEQAEGY